MSTEWSVHRADPRSTATLREIARRQLADHEPVFIRHLRRNPNTTAVTVRLVKHGEPRGRLGTS
jgi:hypothetical protein